MARKTTPLAESPEGKREETRGNERPIDVNLQSSFCCDRNVIARSFSPSSEPGAGSNVPREGKIPRCEKACRFGANWIPRNRPVARKTRRRRRRSSYGNGFINFMELFFTGSPLARVACENLTRFDRAEPPQAVPNLGFPHSSSRAIPLESSRQSDAPWSLTRK